MTKVPSREEFFAVGGFQDEVEACLMRFPPVVQYERACSIVVPQLQIIFEIFEYRWEPILERVKHNLVNNIHQHVDGSAEIDNLVALAGKRFNEREGKAKSVREASDEGIRYFQAERAASALSHLVLMCSEPPEETPYIAAWAISLAWEASLLDPTYKSNALRLLKN